MGLFNTKKKKKGPRKENRKPQLLQIIILMISFTLFLHHVLSVTVTLVINYKVAKINQPLINWLLNAWYHGTVGMQKN